jgi:hypothetical protein
MAINEKDFPNFRLMNHGGFGLNKSGIVSKMLQIIHGHKEHTTWTL